MKKLSKVLAFVLSSALTIGIAGSMSANAIWIESTNIPLMHAEGEVIYDLDCEKGEVSYRSTARNGLYVYGFEYFRYNDIKIKVKDGFDTNEIAKKYLSDIEFDGALDGSSYIRRYDNYVSGDDPRTHESITDKSKQVSEACARMYEDGVIEEAIFTPMLACYYSEYLQQQIHCSYLYGPNEEYFQDEVDDLQAFVNKYTDKGEVLLREYVSGSGQYTMSIRLYDTDLDTYDELAALRDDIDEAYDYEDVIIDYSRPNEGINASSAEINLLDPYICDIDDNGEADISDATQILQSYAESMAGIQNDNVNDKMDVNGDGEINIDDVTYVLTYYAESCAGLR